MPARREVEPNNDPVHAQRIELPAIVDGIVERADYDVFRFRAEAGQLLMFDLLARRAGSRLDGTLGILDERGNELDFNDDYYIHKDPHLEFTVPKSGDYYVRVSGSGEEGSKFSSYRLIAGALPYIWRMLPAGARRGATNELHLAGINLQKIDRLVLGDSLAEGTVLSAGPGALAFRMKVPESVVAGALRIARLRRQAGSTAHDSHSGLGSGGKACRARTVPGTPAAYHAARGRQRISRPQEDGALLQLRSSCRRAPGL